MAVYFYTETAGKFVYATAEKLKAKTLRGAKAEASRKQLREDSTLKIATLSQVTAHRGLLVDYVAIKHFKRWYEE